jgi:hypothetical protein
VDDYLVTASVPCGSRVVTSRWSHLTADTTDELHAFAARLGMRRSWFQPARLVPDTERNRAACPERIGRPFPGSRDHYDVTEKVRALAIRLGAVPVRLGCEPWRDRRRDDRDAGRVLGGEPEFTGYDQ